MQRYSWLPALVLAMGVSAFAQQPVVRQYTVSTLPSASANSGILAIVKDGFGPSDCTTGGGSYVVSCKSNGTAWSAAPAYPIRTVTAATDTATTSDYTVLDNAASAAITETLPASPATGAILHIKKTDTTANTVTVSGNGHNIDGAATQALTQPYESIELQFDGSVWWIL